MTPLLLHGIVARTVPEPLSAPKHLRIAAGALSALATPVPDGMEDADRSLQAALRHHELLSAYALRFDVLPVRFGAAFAGTSGLAAALARERKAFQSGLARLKGRVEYLLWVRPGQDTAPNPVAPTKPVEASVTGRGFLARKRAARDDARTRAAGRLAFANGVPESLDRAGIACQPMPPRGRDELARYALLIDRSAEADLLCLAKALGRVADALGLSVGLRGPGPCYAFSAEGIAPGEITPPTDGRCHA